jgi:hypothetical protein
MSSACFTAHRTLRNVPLFVFVQLPAFRHHRRESRLVLIP